MLQTEPLDPEMPKSSSVSSAWDFFLSLTAKFNNYGFQRSLVNMQNKMQTLKGYISLMWKNA